MTTDRSAPAFPVHKYDGNYNEGMSIRDYFASRAMRSAFENHGVSTEERRNASAELAYKIADAMLKARG